MDTERTGSATQPFIAPPPAAGDGASSPPETFHELVGPLALPPWGLTALSVADEMGLLNALGEPQSVDVPSMVLRGGDLQRGFDGALATLRPGGWIAWLEGGPPISHVVARRPQR